MAGQNTKNQNNVVNARSFIKAVNKNKVLLLALDVYIKSYAKSNKIDSLKKLQNIKPKIIQNWWNIVLPENSKSLFGNEYRNFRLENKNLKEQVE